MLFVKENPYGVTFWKLHRIRAGLPGSLDEHAIPTCGTEYTALLCIVKDEHTIPISDKDSIFVFPGLLSQGGGVWATGHSAEPLERFVAPFPAVGNRRAAAKGICDANDCVW